MSKDDLLSSVYPQFFPAHWLTDAPAIVHTQFPSRIRVGYVTRSDGHYSYLMRPELEESELSVESIHEAALKNLRALPMPGFTDAKTLGGSEAFLGESEDNFTAARILMPVVQGELKRILGEEFLVAIPCRDCFVCWSKKQAPEHQARNFADALKVFRSDEYNLTPDILLFSGSRFSLHQAQEVEA